MIVVLVIWPSGDRTIAWGQTKQLLRDQLVHMGDEDSLEHRDTQIIRLQNTGAMEFSNALESGPDFGFDLDNNRRIHDGECLANHYRL